MALLDLINGEEIRINSLKSIDSIPLNATKIHGITNDDVNKLQDSELILKTYEFIKWFNCY